VAQVHRPPILFDIGILHKRPERLPGTLGKIRGPGLDHGSTKSRGIMGIRLAFRPITAPDRSASGSRSMPGRQGDDHPDIEGETEAPNERKHGPRQGKPHEVVLNGVERRAERQAGLGREILP
jgi:hypothetical protein